MIKCIASDMDGTLLNANQEISQVTEEVIHSVQEKGIEFIIATGRAYNEVKFVFEQTGIRCPAICVNGGEIRDKDGKVLFSIGLDGVTSANISQVLEEFNIYFELYTDKGTYTTEYEGGIKAIVDIYHTANPSVSIEEIQKFAEDRFNQRLIKLVDDFDAIFTAPDCKVYKFLVFSMDEQLLLDVSERLNQIDGLEVTSSGRNNLEIMHKDAQKGIALKKYVESKGISLADTMALGDNYNDLSMLNIVGHSVAMGNAEQPIKDASRYETDTNDDDGVANAIVKILDNMEVSQ
ncbi:Cof-type HAD-IIB family hydrolase [Pseudogracilibacillus auburnensis]|uniref:Cof-type HAD-IIB family hydrolase n=1 Tax=Pseudogracilibacillus auburnensis TaxID=1494959 RepID=UPI001A96110A|nr:Cof-type HAD-IIB family hydrolase [Pseudogracilibacillus auburnensis]MBO1005325.1 HAD family phosphatase [Pseudogracilibacillus auburnensis]